MAAPTIALRFRDTTPGIDTISEHRALLNQYGKFGWGWWKKTFETVDGEKIRISLRGADPIGIILIDRSTQRCFICQCTDFSAPESADIAIVPTYYRGHLAQMAGVFTMLSIAEIEYDAELGDAIGEQTFLWIGTAADPGLGHIAKPVRASGRSCVLHLSDLHFGADYAFRVQGDDAEIGDGRRTLTDCIAADLDRLGSTNDIAAVIVTGDFTTNGEWNKKTRDAALAEFEALRKRLHLTKEQIIALPGNHDVVRYPPDADLAISENAVARQADTDYETQFRTFVEVLIGRSWQASLNYVRRIQFDDTDLDICVLNSCTIVATQWTEYGYVGRGGIDTIVELGRQPIERATFRFLALHHHLLPIGSVEAPNSKGVSLTLDASEILATAQRSRVHVVLHGHQHKPKVTAYQDLPLHGEPSNDRVYIVANGSAGAKNGRLPAGERNTYCLFRIRANEVELRIRELRLDAVAGAQIFQGPLPIAALHAKST
ncbi:MAG: metallophosphoesterase [Rhodospirillales bacterium]|nr:metallophosphoesterase [Rhodospirillales bacterium]